MVEMTRRMMRRARYNARLVEQYNGAVYAIAEELGETTYSALVQIAGYIHRYGMQRCIALVTQAKEIYSNEGLKTKDNSRYRTLGGVWFQLARRYVNN